MATVRPLLEVAVSAYAERMSAGLKPDGVELTAGVPAPLTTTSASQDASSGAGVAQTRSARWANPAADGAAPAGLTLNVSGMVTASTINLVNFTMISVGVTNDDRKDHAARRKQKVPH